MMQRTKAILRRIPGVRRGYRTIRDYVQGREFIRNSDTRLALATRRRIVRQFNRISKNIECFHTAEEAFRFATAILTIPHEMRGCIVEAGCYKGGSTAKFSVAAKMANRKLIVFDSFQGMPANAEAHDRSISGTDVKFPEGSYCGPLDVVRKNVKRFGNIEVCQFVPGWFDESMPSFRQPIVAVFLDVDLASSTKTCLKYLYPQIVPGGVLFSHDGHLPLVLDVFNDETFWRDEVGCEKPAVHGLGCDKLVEIRKVPTRQHGHAA